MNEYNQKDVKTVNPFSTNVPLLYPLKKDEHRSGTLIENRLINT